MLLNSLFTKFCIFSCCALHVAVEKIILWHVDLLLANDRETSNYATTITKQRLCKQTFPRQRENSNNVRDISYVIRAEML
jgi:hypothetical protein